MPIIVNQAGLIEIIAFDDLSDMPGGDINVGIVTASGYLSCLNFTNSYHYTGFPNRDDTSLSWDDGTYTLTLTASDDKIWINGVEYNIDTLTKQFTVGQEAVTGLYWYWITAPGGTPQLNTSTTTPNIGGGGANAGFDQCLTATVYWNTTTSKGLLSDERHWFGRDAWMHEYLHETISARYYEGMGGTFNNTTITIEAGEFYDEDIEHTNAQETVCTVLYHNGDATWAWTANLSTPYKVVNPGVDDTLQYNNGTALASVSNSKFANYWVFITPDQTDPVQIIIAQAQHNTIALARAESSADLSLGTLPSAEMKLIYKLIYKNVGGTPTYQDSQDYRSVSSLPAQYSATSHPNLSGLAWTSAMHSGTASTFAGFDGSGLAAEYTEANYLLTAGTRALAGAWDMGSQNLTNVNIDSGSVDAITSLTVANNVDIGNYTLTANGLTIDGTFTDGTLSIVGGEILNATTLEATTTLGIEIGDTQQLVLTDGKLNPTTDSDVDLGDATHYYKDCFFDTITTTGNVVIAGDLEINQHATFDAEFDNGNSGAADTVDWGVGNKQMSTLTDNVTYTFTAPDGVGNFILRMVQDAGGTNTVTWPATVLWPAATEPTWDTTGDYVNIATFYWNGSHYYGAGSTGYVIP